MKVNMTPNPLDVVTIHASQGDTEARQWEFELHNNGELIDTSEVTEQMFFKAYKGGTEQILPENTSTPTTSPFLGDIRYPQGLLTDQEFLYRESPTEEDGLAKIADVKGNTLVWNQLVNNGNFASTSGWKGYGANDTTLTASNNELTVKAVNGGLNPYLYDVFQENVVTKANHKCIATAEVYTTSEKVFNIVWARTHSSANVRTQANAWTKLVEIYTPTTTETAAFIIHNNSQFTTDETYKVRNVMLIDLTQMGLDISSPSDFTSLFPLSYYSYNQGSLLSFMGNGIKTVGKNLLKLADKSGTYNGITYSCVDNVITFKGTASGTSVIDFSIDGGFLRLYPRFQYTKSLSPTGTYSNVQTSLRGQNADFVNVGFWTNNANPSTMSNLDADAYYFRVQINSGVSVDCTLSVQLEIGNVATSYEPYTSSTLSLPISTYFPTGMKSIDTVYDEWTPIKALRKVGSITIDGNSPINNNGTAANSSNFIITVTDKANGQYNIKSNLFEVGNTVSPYKMIGRASSKYVEFALPVSVPQTVADGQAWFAQHPTTLYYELETPTETSFTTASLVTENAEIPLSNNDGVLIGKCTEQLSENPGFIDAKIKLSDSDGECYSNKLQLHVERSPQ